MLAARLENWKSVAATLAVIATAIYGGVAWTEDKLRKIEKLTEVEQKVDALGQAQIELSLQLKLLTAEVRSERSEVGGKLDETNDKLDMLLQDRRTIVR